MEIALTKKFADQIKLNLHPKEEELNPLFSWTANWTNVYDQEDNDLLVLENNATRFVVAVYLCVKEGFYNIEEISTDAIRGIL